jgi:hypothetical protein
MLRNVTKLDHYWINEIYCLVALHNIKVFTNSQSVIPSVSEESQNVLIILN